VDDLIEMQLRLMQQVQSGEPVEALATADALLGEPTGDIADGFAGLHFVRVVAFSMLGELAAHDEAIELMIAAAERDRSPGWLAAALATKASQQIRIAEAHNAAYDLDDALRSLVTAQLRVAEETDPVPALAARVALGISFFETRLYELAWPNHLAAYEIALSDPRQYDMRAMWLCNIAETHLRWALELYQVGLVEEAESHTAEAERWALRAAAEVGDGPEADTWREYALLSAACAKADRHDPQRALAEIERHLEPLEARGMSEFLLAFSRPFHAVALRRSGRPDEALRIIERAIEQLPPDVGMFTTSAMHHTHAVLLAGQDSAGVEAALAWGRTLASTLWHQRMRTLQTVETMRSLENLRIQHEQAAHAADRDALTGIANRRAFDEAVRRAQSGPGEIAVLLVDTDRFKQINDSFGHAAGDAALRSIARALDGQVHERDLLARLGGDEFAVLLPEVTETAARETATRMVLAVRDIPNCPATLSIGIAVGHTTDLPHLLEQADAAMYRAKRRGGDGIDTGAAEATHAA
jgi:diguanylate cyclase (GGDEF)-like protein